MVGDSVDNIPGVPGIGPKRAAEVVGACTSLTEALARPDRLAIGARLQAALEEHRERIERNLQLVRLRTDLETVDDWTRMEVHPPPPDKLLPFFERLEFGSMAKELREPDLFER